jgi:hypothetical protein
MKRSLMIAMSGVGLAVACAIAGPLDKTRVDATAKWLVHADVEAVMASRAGRFIAEHRAEFDLEPIEEFRKKTGVDAFKDIKDVTVYGTTDSPDEAVAVIHGTAKLEAAVDALMGEDKTVEKVQLGGRAVYKWVEDGTARFGYLKVVGGEGRAFLVSQKADHLERALKVMDGGEASLATVKAGPLAGSPRKGAMVYLAVSELGAVGEDAPKVLQNAKEVRAEFGEDEGGLYGELKLKAGAAEDVRNMADFGRGLLALGRMASSGDPELKDFAKVIDGVKIDVSGTELTASFRIGKELLDAALSEIKDHQKREAQPAIEKTSKEEKKGR